MAESQACPSRKALLDFVAGRLDGPTRGQIDDHLSTCRKCAQAIEWISSNLPTEADGGPTLGSSTSNGSSSRGGMGPETEGWDRLDDDRFDGTLLRPSARQDALGRLGEYDILDKIGHGGMGVVFKAFDERLHRAVAIKVMNRHLATSPTARRRFMREARAAAGINHQNVVTIYAVEEHQGYPMLVMEFIGGGTLREHIHARGRLEPLEVIRLSKEIAAGLAAAHAHGVIHRDIKPGNILLEGGAVRVIITDFGLARAAIDNLDLTSQGHAVGTPAYMSPEQVKGEKVDLRSDLFSLGCVMYAMGSGHSPFRGSNSLEMARKVAEFDPPPLSEVCEETPPGLSEIVGRLLQKDPNERYQSATEVAEVLGRYLEVLHQTPTGQMSEALRGLRSGGGNVRRRIRWVAAATLIVLLTIVASLWAWRPWAGSATIPGSGPPGPAGAEIYLPGTYPKSITVAGDGEADVRSIPEAVALAGPDTVIHVAAGRRYVENVDISEPVRLRGLHLEADAGPRAERATLAASDDTLPVIQIDGVSDVVIRGFRIEGSSEGAIAIVGQTGGVVVEDVQCTGPETEASARPGVAIRAERPAGASRPIIVRNSRIECLCPGQCVLLVGSRPAATDVRLEGNRFAGRGVLVLLVAKPGDLLGDTVITGNLFVGGAGGHEQDNGEWYTTNGVNLNLQTRSPNQIVLINNNTFVNVRTWLGLVLTSTEAPGVTVANNLILQSEGVKGSWEQLQAAAETWRFEANWWEPAPVTEEPLDLQTPLAKIQPRIEVLHRDDPDHPDFLDLPPDSPLVSTGWGEEGLPTYVGARAPSDAGG